MTTQNAVSATSAIAKQAAESVIVKGGALSAVVAGAFAAAAEHDSVLLSSVQVLAGGSGVGLFAWDGRVRQPGRGVSRPRGFLPEDDVPEAARVGASAFVASLVAVLSHAGTLTLARALAPAIALAKKTPREAVLRRIAERGPRAMSDFHTPILAAAGRLVGGLLTEDDLEITDHLQKRARIDRDGAIGVARVPWMLPHPVPEKCIIHTISAADRSGGLAVLCYEEHEIGIEIPELGLRAPLVAVPVTRGQVRVRPGSPLEATSTIALLTTSQQAVAAIGARPGVDPEVAITNALAAYREQRTMTETSVIGVIHGEKNPSVWA